MTDSNKTAEPEAARELVARIRTSDRSAETEIVQRYSRGLRFLLRRKTGNEQLAEDLLQETWAIALVKLRESGLDEPERLAGYLCGIASNLASSERRRVQRQQTTANSEIVDLVPDDTASPFERASRAETCRHVRGLLDELTQERDREILTRFYVREEDKEHICRDLGVDDSHFNRVLFRARQRLKDLMVRERLRERLQLVTS